MEDKCNSWVRRTNFSQTICYRLDFSLLPSTPFSYQLDCRQGLKPKNPTSFYSKLLTSISLPVVRKVKAKHKNLRLHSQSFQSIPFSSQSDVGGCQAAKRSILGSSDILFYPKHDVKSGTMNLDSSIEFGPPVGVQLDHECLKSANLAHGTERGSKSKLRSVSHLPTTILSDVLKEARDEKKRFLTPPPTTRGLDKRVFGRVFSRGAHENDKLLSSESQAIPLQKLFGMKNSSKIKGRKEANWMRFFDHGVGKVASVDNTEEWMVDLAQLYLGFRFAFGAHSRLYHGIYKEKAVAVKIIQLPEDDEDKVMAARLEKQFRREVKFLWNLSHRNVIKLEAACRNPPIFCIVTEYLPGGTLRAFLHKLGHELLPLEKLISIALDITRGMQFIHSQGVIHRDLKPENILFDQDSCVKIADFGIACEEAYSDPLAEDPGTYRWMAPEMIKLEHYGKKVDVYSFGLVLWEMVTGRIPYEDMTPVQAAFAVVDKDLRPAIPKDCPAALRALIEQCWASNPEKRPEFWQIVEELEQFEATVAQGGTLNEVEDLTCHDHSKWMVQWTQKLKFHPHAHGSGFFAPKLL